MMELEAERPEGALVQAALGALALERGRLQEAEEHLSKAVRNPRATALTHHRYALMLLNPSDTDPRERAELSADHAARAASLAPSEPQFARTLAHANIAAGKWEEAADALRGLLREPEWSETAARDFAELERNRWQQIWQTSRPVVAAASPDTDFAFSHAPLEPLREPHDYPWPPPDTQIMVGRIDYVDCSSGEKIIRMYHPLFDIRFVEKSNQPAKLHHPPLKWETLPCGTKGWSVNIAYKPYRGRGSLRGEARAILF